MPSGTTVEVLCGQPEQKYGVRAATSCNLGERVLRLFQPRDLGRDRVVMAARQQPLADADRDLVRIERALDREQPVAALVLLADADRLVGGAVQLLAHLHFDQRALLLDHDDEVEALGEVDQFVAAGSARAADLEQANAELVAAAPRRCRVRRAPGARRDRPCRW